MKRFFMYVTLVFAIGASGPKANNLINNPTNPKQIPDSIVVTANRKATPVKEIGSSVTVITENDIQKSQESSVAEILRTVPGLNVVQSGGTGKATSVFMRGANSHHTLVIIDGIEMNDPSSPNGAFDFAHLNSGNIQRIEILRGSQSVLYGSDAIGGVIQIFTKRGFGEPSVSLQSEVGSYNSFNESAIISGSKDKFDYSVFLSRKDSDGFSATTDTLGTKENDGYENSEIATHLGYNLSDKFELNFTGKYLDAKADIDNSWGIFEDPNYINQSITKNISLQLNKFGSDDFWIPSVKLLYLNNEYEAINETDTEHPDDASNFNSSGTKFKISSLNNFNINSNNILSIGVESEIEKFDSDFSSESAWGPYSETITEKENRISSVYALEEISLNNRWF
ncbi:MAG: TonB-dependent receptor plug domain-containing protein, partial [candidate division Zixibacteria bacterium]|nr:TonB-dependent receptor plug domain-containing protein [candidate division Zixibacteria bacterium]